jgi:hypothetical protein
VLIVPEQHVPVVDAVSLSAIPMLERARLACNTARELFGDAPEPSEDDKTRAREAFKAFTDAGGVKAPSMSVVATYPNASLVYLDRMLSEYDHELINSAVRIREYTKNKLLVESENPDGKIRIRALELLGKMKDVGLFTDRVEVTHKTKTDAELEEELHKKLERYMGSALVVEDAEEVEEDDEDSDMPPPPKHNDITQLDGLIDQLTP